MTVAVISSKLVFLQRRGFHEILSVPELAAGCWLLALIIENWKIGADYRNLSIVGPLITAPPPAATCPALRTSVLWNFTVANQGSHSLGESSLPCVKLSHEMYYWTKGSWYLWMHMIGAVLRSASVGNVFITGSWGSINGTPPPQVAGDHELTLGMQLQSHNQHQCWTWSWSWQIKMYWSQNQGVMGHLDC